VYTTGTRWRHAAILVMTPSVTGEWMCATSGANEAISAAAAAGGRQPRRIPSYQGQRTEPRRVMLTLPSAQRLPRRRGLGATTTTVCPRPARPRASPLVTAVTPPTIGSY
jgi:hypothetical protein